MTSKIIQGVEQESFFYLYRCPPKAVLCLLIQRDRKETKSEGAKQSLLAGVKGHCIARGSGGMPPLEKFGDEAITTHPAFEASLLVHVVFNYYTGTGAVGYSSTVANSCTISVD